MQIPLEITYRDVPKNEEIDRLIRQRAAKLETFCDYMTSCRVTLEMPGKGMASGNAFLVSLDIRVPPGQEIVVRQEVKEGEARDVLSAAVRGAFDTAGRRLRDLVERQRRETTPPDEGGLLNKEGLFERE
jgi:hypothetical protein